MCSSARVVAPGVGCVPSAVARLTSGLMTACCLSACARVCCFDLLHSCCSAQAVMPSKHAYKPVFGWFHLLSRCCFSVGGHMPAMSVRRIGPLGAGTKPCTSFGVVPLARWVFTSSSGGSGEADPYVVHVRAPSSLVAVEARAWLSPAPSQGALLCMTELHV